MIVAQSHKPVLCQQQLAEASNLRAVYRPVPVTRSFKACTADIIVCESKAADMRLAS